MQFDLRALGFPCYDEVEKLYGITPAQYYDVLKYLHQEPKRPWYVELFQRPRLVTGFDVHAFIRSQERPARSMSVRA